MTDAIDCLEGYLKGKADGAKEVMDWMRKQCSNGDTIYVSWDALEAQLKEWGME